MATAKKAPAKKAGEWKAETVKEWKSSEAVTWRAQKSTSPEGQKFIGVRQYVSTKTKGEIAGRSGITFVHSEEGIKALDKVIVLMTALRASLGKPSKYEKPEGKTTGIKKSHDADGKPVKAIPAKKRVRKGEEQDEPAEDADYVLVRDGNVYMASCRTDEDGKVKIKSTEDSDKAQTFKLKRAQKVLEGVSDRWSLQEL